jgi:uncharacterized membrane protein YeaQ/YmgE (transglycosylase-associated protein family)
MAIVGTILAWIVFGLVVGLISRALYPGSQKMSLPNTIALGIAGSLLGGGISYLLGYRPQENIFQRAGWILSIVGGLIVVWMAMALGSRKT